MKQLNIAVDCRPLAQPMVGITRYTHEFISRLVCSPHHWFLYFDKPPVHPIPDLPNVHIRCGSVKSNFLSTLYAQCFFPFWAVKDRIDVFWSPRHHLPILLPRHIRKIVTIHDLVWKLYPQTMNSFGRIVESLLMPLSIRMSQRVLTVSEATLKDVADFFPASKSKLATIYPGVTRGLSELSNSLDFRYFLFVGTLEPRKNLRVLLEAFSRFSAKYEGIKLLIVGGKGWGGISLDTLVVEMGLQDDVVLMDRVSEQELSCFYVNALALVMPSLYEGFGLPLLESMGYGIPVITANSGAMKEVAADAGILVDQTSVVELAGAMGQMLDIVQHKSLAEKARLRALDFCWDRSTEKILSEIENLGTLSDCDVK